MHNFTSIENLFLLDLCFLLGTRVAGFSVCSTFETLFKIRGNLCHGPSLSHFLSDSASLSA